MNSEPIRNGVTPYTTLFFRAGFQFDHAIEFDAAHECDCFIYTTVVVDFHAANDEFCTFWRSIGLVHLLVHTVMSSQGYDVRNCTPS